jgi:transposase
MEFNPVLLSKFNHSQTLRKTKSDAIDCALIARYLMTVEYKPYPIGFYHMYSLKSLTRLRDSFVRQRSFYLVKITNVLDHTFPEFKPFFNKRLGKTALLLLTKYGSATKISSMNSRSYDELRRASRGRFSMCQFLELRTLAKNTVGVSNTIFELELSSLLNLYQNLCSQVTILESEINILVTELDRPTQSIPGIGPTSAAVILSEFGDISRFKSSGSMLSFAGLEPAYYQSGTSEYTGHMVKRGSSHLRYTLMTVCIPLIRYNIVFAEYYHKKRLEGKPHRVALSHVAKKLLRVIFTLETRNIVFDPEKIR